MEDDDKKIPTQVEYICFNNKYLLQTCFIIGFGLSLYMKEIFGTYSDVFCNIVKMDKFSWYQFRVLLVFSLFTL